MQYKVLLADDHELLLEGISSILKDLTHINIVATAKNGFEVITGIKLHKPHLVLLDLNMPGYDGIQCLQTIKKDFPETRVLVLTNYNQPELITEIKKLGGNGFLSKNSSASELSETIGKVLSGFDCFPDKGKVETIKESSVFFDDFLKKYQLTKREVGIIQLICQGLSTKQIAEKLFLSEFTITTHRRNIFRKLDINNVTSLLKFAQSNLLV